MNSHATNRFHECKISGPIFFLISRWGVIVCVFEYPSIHQKCLLSSLCHLKKKRKIEGENGTKVLGSCQNNHNNSCSSNHTSSCQNNHKLLCNSNSTTTLARLTSDFEERSGLKLWEPEYLVMLQPALLDL